MTPYWVKLTRHEDGLTLWYRADQVVGLADYGENGTYVALVETTEWIVVRERPEDIIQQLGGTHGT